MLKIDSRKVELGDTFLKMESNSQYESDAIKNGAINIIEGDNKYLEEYLYNTYYDYIKDIKLIGITGTNGKTTTCYLIYQALNLLNIKCAYIGTLGFYINDKIIETTNTTPSLYDLYNYLIKCKENNCEYVVMEVSSQGISMGRINTLKFSYMAFTNLTQDHLDYHKTMENYRKEKEKLFTNSSGIAIINSDDESYKYFIKENNKNITFGKNSKNNNLKIIDMDLNGTHFKLNGKEYFTKLIGEYNVYNLAIVIILLNELNLEVDISKLLPPKGRMEKISYNDSYIFIDYAHTPDAVLKIISNVKKICNGKIITIIGCGGNRDKTKRPIMGDISTKLSDYVIFTTDNPRFENKMKIIKDITCKLDKNNYKIIVNRAKAIKKGIQMLEKNDILLLLGKGHENYQDIKGKKTYFSDLDTVLNITRR